MTTAQPETVQGISVREYLCWQVMGPGGQVVDMGDGEPHFEREASALDYADWAKAVQREQPCWSGACAECEYVFDEEGTWITHFDDAESAVRDITSCGWRVIDGRLLCEECAVAADVGAAMAAQDGGQADG